MRPRGRPMRADGPRPTLIYDGECGFCRRSVDLLRRWDREQRIALVPFQDQARVAAFGIPLPALAAAMHLVLPPPDTRVRSEERRVGKECRSRRSTYYEKKKERI